MIQAIIVIIIISVVAFLSYRYIKVHKQNDEIGRLRAERVKPLYEKIESGQTITDDFILPFAQNILARRDCFQLLNTSNRADLFPQEYFTFIKAAESDLANWLEFPTELGACPDEIEHLKRVTIDFDGQNNFVHYEVFRYRTYEPHWPAKVGWILGVVGPYFDDSSPYDNANSTFSRIGSMDNGITQDDEAKWVHKNISLRRQ